MPLSMFRTIGPRLLVLAMAFPCWSATADDEPVDETPAAVVASWAKPVPGWTPVRPGEHPRLFFRKADLPALRERMRTEEGRAILAQLRATLGGGEAMPTVRSPARIPYSRGGNSPLILKQPGAYTISHAAGFGFLYQLTGEAKYAALARQCVELALDGQRDRDDRYSLVLPGGQLRAGPSLAWYAAAYDLCYDAWDPAFRSTVAKALLTFNGKDHLKEVMKADPTIKDPGEMDLLSMAKRPRHMPTSNHFGSIVGGTAIALLALRGDPGVDDAAIEEGLASAERRIIAIFTSGFGDAGWFAEGPGPSHMAANPALAPALQAFKVAAGRDLTQAPAVEWMTMRWAYDLIPGRNGRPRYPCRMIGGNASYGTDDFLGPENGGGLSHGGWFSQGFGIIPEDKKPALLWTWQHVVKEAMKDNYDAANYPHRAMLAFLNWPIGMVARNPGEILPRIRHDTVHGYLSTRNRWQDADDVILSVWTQSGPRGWIGRKPGDMNHTGILVFGNGHRVHIGRMSGAAPRIAWQRPDGSLGISNGPSHVAIDFSGQAGVEALIASAQRDYNARSPDTAFIISDRNTRLAKERIGLTSFHRSGIHPAPKTGTERVVVGGQTVVMRDDVFAFVPLDGVAPGLGADTLDAQAINAARLAKDDVPAAEIALPTAPPILHLDFDAVEQDGATRTVADRGPNRLKAELLGGAVLEEGILGQAVALNGADGHVVVPAHPSLDLQGRSVSISAWFKLTTSEPGEEFILLEKNRWRGGATPDCYSFVVDPSSQLMFNIPAINTSQPGHRIDCADDAWHHAVATFDVAKGVVSLYYDGWLRVAKRTREGGAIGAGSAPLTIGARGTGVKASNFLGGLVDDVRVYDRVLTRGEVRALTLQGIPRPSPP